jgi:hypothetical protein
MWWTLLAQLSHSQRKQQNFCNLLGVPSKGSCLQITADLQLIYPVPHTTETFLHIFIFFLFVVCVSNGYWRHYISRHAKTLAFRLRKQESVNIRHSYGPYLMFIVAIWPSTILQALSSPCVIKACSKLSWRERNAVILTVSSRRFNCWSLADNSCAFLLDSFRSLIRSEYSFCVILCSSAEVRFRKTSGYPAVDSRWLLWFLGFFSCSSSLSREKLSGVLE